MLPAIGLRPKLLKKFYPPGPFEKWYSKDSMERLKNEYNRARRRLLLLDYDGVLVPIAPTPEAAVPSQALLSLLRKIAADPRNTIVIISGRSPETLDQWLGKTGVDMSAEHGHFFKRRGDDWQRVSAPSDTWKTEVRRHMVEAVRQVPSSHIEEKHTGLVWHYRQSPGDLANEMAQTLHKTLSSLGGLHVSHGSKVVEARLPGADKGRAAGKWLTSDFDFVLAAGDDTTDEDLFKAMPSQAFTIKIGPGPTAARMRLESSHQFLSLLANVKEGDNRS